ncbi:MAG: hypothetical protein ACI8P2_003606, partial [Candidatus Latescibacterota bacterium]
MLMMGYIWFAIYDMVILERLQRQEEYFLAPREFVLTKKPRYGTVAITRFILQR